MDLTATARPAVRQKAQVHVMADNTYPRFAAGRVPGVPEEWPRYRKRTLTAAVRIVGPFVVDTTEGPLTCQDGWLALDARGFPYPIAADEFDLIYEPADV